MTISIALCTYNGGEYLQEQLESYLRQSRLPDEVVVCDDGSQDETIALLSAFAKRAPFSVRLYVNPERLGSTRNFERAVGLCEGDLIALSDQDDVWLPQKLELSERVLYKHPLTRGVFSDATLVNEALQPLDSRLWHAAGFDREKQRRFAAGDAFSVLLQRQVVTGATLIFRAEYRDLLLPIPGYSVHDAWIALMLAAVGRLACLEEPLILYRQHGRNQIGAAKRSVMDRIIDHDGDESVRKRLHLMLQFCSDAHERLMQTNYPLEDERILTLLRSKIQHIQSRLSLSGPRWQRIGPVISELISGRYSKFSYGLFSAARDIMAPRNPA